MKIKPEHLQYMKAEIDATLATHGADALVTAYSNGEFHNADKVKDLQKRFCFDLLYGAGLASWVCDNVYSYANDDHLFTALKAICPKVERLY